MSCFYGALRSEPEFWNSLADSKIWTWWLPGRTVVTLRYRFRCLQKRLQTQKSKAFENQATSVDTPKWTRRIWPFNCPSLRPSASVPSASGLEQLFSTYPTLISLSNNLHYSDLTNLSMASKRMRNALLPPHGHKDRIRILRRECGCEKDTDMRCYGCDIQICMVRLPI